MWHFTSTSPLWKHLGRICNAMNIMVTKILFSCHIEYPTCMWKHSEYACISTIYTETMFHCTPEWLYLSLHKLNRSIHSCQNPHMRAIIFTATTPQLSVSPSPHLAWSQVRQSPCVYLRVPRASFHLDHQNQQFGSYYKLYPEPPGVKVILSVSDP